MSVIAPVQITVSLLYRCPSACWSCSQGRPYWRAGYISPSVGLFEQHKLVFARRCRLQSTCDVRGGHSARRSQPGLSHHSIRERSGDCVPLGRPASLRSPCLVPSRQVVLRDLQPKSTQANLHNHKMEMTSYARAVHANNVAVGVGFADKPKDPLDTSGKIHFDATRSP